MRWNCPHCGVNLGIADDKMSTSWSFSRCYQCGGYALVRKSEVNIIKVDRVPPGEKIILPESAENPLLSETATRNLNRLTQANSTQPQAQLQAKSQSNASSSPALNAQAEKPIVKPATRRNTGSGMINPLHSAQAASASAATAGAEIAQVNPVSAMDIPSDKLSYAQPFAPASHEASARPLAGPHAPAGASVDRSAMPAYLNGVNNMGLFPDPLPEVPAASGRIRLLPMAIGIAAAFALGSGLYLLMQSGEIIEKTRPTLSNHRAAPSTSTSTPSTDDNEIAAIHSSRAAKNVTVAKVDQAQAPSHSASNAMGSPSSYSDQVRSQAMAPDRQQPIPTAPKPVQLSSDNPPLLVQPKAKNIHLRSGPGMIYPVVGNADEKAKYIVTDWNDRWFKVLPQTGANAAQNSAQNNAQANEEIAGWIRTDSVQVVPASGGGTL